MNIKEAKEQIKYAVKSYLTRDEFGDFEIPIERQRPIFLMGPPGIGKTAVMEQITSELGVRIVSYSMTHHTRQSALGLPFIRPFAKLRGHIKITDTSNQRKTKGKTLSAISVFFGKNTETFYKAYSMLYINSLF